MKTLIVLLAAAAVMAQSPSLLAQTPPPAGTTDAAKTGTKEGNETSDRTPEKQSVTPETQVDTTKQGDTSDRTPSKDGAVKDPSTAPAAGATETVPAGNPFTMEDARKHLMQMGYTNVSELVKDAQGKWVGSATKDGKTVPVAVDVKPAVTTK